MDSIEYRRYLQTNLIKKFKEDFYNKTGIHPVVSIAAGDDDDEPVPRIPLDELRDLCDIYIPKYYKDKFKSIAHPTKTRAIYEIRVVYCHIAKTMGYTTSYIGESLGSRDHTTVLHSQKEYFTLIGQENSVRGVRNSVLNDIRKKYNVPTPIQSTNETTLIPEPVLPTMAL